MSDLARALLDEIAADPEAIERLRELIGPRHDDGRWIGVHEAAEHLSCKPTADLRSRAPAAHPTRARRLAAPIPTSRSRQMAESAVKGSPLQSALTSGPSDARTSPGPVSKTW
jgi:hypothetical protein